MVLQYAPADTGLVGNAVGVCRVKAIAVDGVDRRLDDFYPGVFAFGRLPGFLSLPGPENEKK